MPSFLLIFHSINDYYILAGGFNSTRIVENVRAGLIQDGQQIHVFMTSTTHGDTLYLKLTLSLKLKKDLVFGASHRIYICNLLICAFNTHLWRCIYILKTFLPTVFIKLNYLFTTLLIYKSVLWIRIRDPGSGSMYFYRKKDPQRIRNNSCGSGSLDPDPCIFTGKKIRNGSAIIHAIPDP